MVKNVHIYPLISAACHCLEMKHGNSPIVCVSKPSHAVCPCSHRVKPKALPWWVRAFVSHTCTHTHAFLHSDLTCLPLPTLSALATLFLTSPGIFPATWGLHTSFLSLDSCPQDGCMACSPDALGSPCRHHLPRGSYHALYKAHTHTLTAGLCHHALLSLFFIAFLYYFGLSPPLECNRHTSRVCSIQCLPPEPTTAPGMHSTLWTFVQWIHVAWTRTALTLPYTEKTQHSKVCIQKNELHRREIIHTIIEEIIKEHVFLVHFKWDSVCTDLMHVGSSGRFALCFQKESGVFLLCEVVTLLNWTVGVVIRKWFTHSPRMRYKFVDIHRTWIWHFQCGSPCVTVVKTSWIWE